MMGLILTILLIMVIGGVYMMNKTRFDGIGFVLTIISGAILTLALILLPTSYYSTKSDIQEYYSIEQTIHEARQNNISEVERAALTQKIVEVNQWLTSTKYWNNSIFDIYYPDEIENLKPLK